MKPKFKGKPVIKIKSKTCPGGRSDCPGYYEGDNCCPITGSPQCPDAKADSPVKAMPASPEGQPLHLKWRPRHFEEVLGQDQVVKSLRKSLASRNRPHAFLFTGPSGTGKTTLARIVAMEVGVPTKDILEIDAATHSGVDNMRGITDQVRYKSLRDENGKRFVIVDEAHAISKAAWQSMLKAIEEPPAHVYWAFCTTEPDKVPETIRTRCASYQLRDLGTDEIDNLLTAVRDHEGIDLSDELVGVLARYAHGSARRALVYLAQCAGMQDKKEVLRLIETGVGEEGDAIELARVVCNKKGFTWDNCMKILARLEKENAEGIRLHVVGYAQAAIKDTRDPTHLLNVLDCFKGPYYTADKWGPLYLSLGKLFFEQE